jgi:hypothetical protein
MDQFESSISDRSVDIGTEGLEHIGQLLMLISTSCFEVMEHSCFHPLQNKSVCSFDLPVSLRMCCR